MIVAFQGTKGAFHERAAKDFFTDQIFLPLGCETFRDVFAAVQDGSADYGVIAIENSLHGSINPVYSLLASNGVKICGEVRLHIQLYLIGHDNHGIDMVNIPITKVYSQREALGQCQDWLAANLANAEVVEYSDTAEAVKMVMAEQSSEKLAIAGREAARVYHAEVIAGPINDDPENYTRFVVISKNGTNVTDANRTSIIMNEDEDQAGKLYDALGIFSKHNINLSKLHSHPRPGKKRLYSFYIDFDTSLANAVKLNILEELKEQGWMIKILGSYKASETQD